MQAFCTKYASEISKNMRKLINLVEKSLKTALKLIFSMKCKIFLVLFFGQLPGQLGTNLNLELPGHCPGNARATDKKSPSEILDRDSNFGHVNHQKA